MKTKDQIEFIKGLISAHFDKGYFVYDPHSIQKML